MAEQERRGAFVGLAVASALVVLIASGVAISRLGSDARSTDRVAQTAASAPAPESSGPTGLDAGAGHVDTTSAASSSTSAPVPPPVPAEGASAGRAAASTGPSGAEVASGSSGKDGASGADKTGTGGTSGASNSARSAAAGSGRDGSTRGGSGEAGNSEAGNGQAGNGGAGNGGADNGGSPHDGQPGPEHSPGSSALLTGSVSAGQGANGVVVGVGLGDSPETDVTVGTTPVLGDAPPSHGTGIGLGGRFLNPPPTVPVPPG